MTSIKAHGQFNASLNGYRGLCALHVFVHHAGTAGILAAPALTGPDESLGLPWSLLRFGGPEMFFMISGYLILGSLHRAGSVREFLRDRFIRIYCAWLPTLLILSLVFRATNMKVYAGVSNLAALGIFSANLLLLPPLLPLPLVHIGSWTLSYEWLFYFAAAIGITLLRRTPRPRVAWWAWLAGCGLMVCLLPSTLFFLTGVLVLWKSDWLLRHRRWLRFPLLSFAVYLAAWRLTDAYKSEIWTTFFDWLGDHRAPAAIVAFVASLHVFACICFETSPQLGFLKTRAFQFLGNVSYSLYLWHLLVMGVVKRAIVPQLLASSGPKVAFCAFFFLALAITLLVSWASWQLFEVRFAKAWRRSWRQWSAAVRPTPGADQAALVVRDGAASEVTPIKVVRAVLITATEPEPRRYGKAMVLGGILDHLCERLGAENVHVILVGAVTLQRPPVRYTRHVIAKPSAREQVRALIMHVLVPTLARRVIRISLQEAALRATRLEHALRSQLQTIDADLQIWDTVRMGQYAPSVARRRRILYADDLFSERYLSLLGVDGSGPIGNPGGDFQRFLPGPLGRWLATPQVHRPLLRIEHALVAASEARQPTWFDTTLLIGPDEAARLRARCPGNRIDSVPPLLREPTSSTRPSPGHVRSELAPHFVFIGGFDYAPNLDGIDWFLRTCRSAVLDVLPDVRIAVVGSGTQRGLPSAEPWGERIRFLGWVDDLDAVLARSVALLSPLRCGSGVKIKVLEALGRGLPVIATPLGVQGIERPERGGCIVADDARGLAAGMLAACDPQRNAELSAAARAAWQSCYAPAVVRQRYDAILGLNDPGVVAIDAVAALQCVGQP